MDRREGHWQGHGPASLVVTNLDNSITEPGPHPASLATRPEIWGKIHSAPQAPPLDLGPDRGPPGGRREGQCHTSQLGWCLRRPVLGD